MNFHGSQKVLNTESVSMLSLLLCPQIPWWDALFRLLSNFKPQHLKLTFYIIYLLSYNEPWSLSVLLQVSTRNANYSSKFKISTYKLLLKIFNINEAGVHIVTLTSHLRHDNDFASK